MKKNETSIEEEIFAHLLALETAFISILELDMEQYNSTLKRARERIKEHIEEEMKQ